MINAPYEKEFVFHDGHRTKNLLELYDKIKSMGQDSISSFANDSKNDFSNWIDHVLLDKALAERIRPLHTKDALLEIIGNRINEHTAQESLITLSKKEISITPPLGHRQLEVVHNHSTAHQGHDVHITTTSPHTTHTMQHKMPGHKDDLHGDESKTGHHDHASKTCTDNTYAKNKWYTLLLRKGKGRLHPEHEHAASQHLEPHAHDPHAESHIEHKFWVTLYAILIMLIIGLLVYRFTHWA